MTTLIRDLKLSLRGTLGFTVVQRTREFGVRMAIGARPADIMRLVIREGMLLTAIGMSIGACGAFFLSSTLAGLVYGVRATDPAVWFASVFAIFVTSAVASWIPARRAAALDPAAIVRTD